MEELKYGDISYINGKLHHWNGLTWLIHSEWVKFQRIAEEIVNSVLQETEILELV